MLETQSLLVELRVEIWRMKADQWQLSSKSVLSLEKKGRSQYHHTFTYIMSTLYPNNRPVPRLKQCTLSGYSSEMPSNSYINSQSKLHQKNNSEFKLLVEGRTAGLILKRLWPRNSWLCLLGNWTMVQVQGIEANEYYNELAIFNPSDSQAQRARKSRL